MKHLHVITMARQDCTASPSFGSTFLDYLKKPRHSLRKRLSRSKKTSDKASIPAKPELSRPTPPDQIKSETKNEIESEGESNGTDDDEEEEEEEEEIQVTTRRISPTPSSITTPNQNEHAASSTSGPSPDEQKSSLFFQKLPLEIRRMIYTHLWQRESDEYFHNPRGRHLYYDQGRWSNFRCVMSERDDDCSDNIQTQMDRLFVNSPAPAAATTTDRHHNSQQLSLWQSRLTTLWGPRHWECERIASPENRCGPRVHHRGFLDLFSVCKRLYPEMLVSVLEYHTWVLCDMGSAHRWLVTHPPSSPPLGPPLLAKDSIRSLDLHLSLHAREYATFAFFEGGGNEDEEGNEEEKKKKRGKKGRIRQLSESLGKLETLQDLRMGFDVRGYGPWRKLPELGVVRSARLDELSRQPFLKSFILELPAELKLAPDYLVGDVRSLEDVVADDGEKEGWKFEVRRRPGFRYWRWAGHGGGGGLDDDDDGENEGEEEEEEGKVHRIRWLETRVPLSQYAKKKKKIGNGKGIEGEKGGREEWNTSLVIGGNRGQRGGTVMNCPVRLDWGVDMRGMGVVYGSSRSSGRRGRGEMFGGAGGAGQKGKQEDTGVFG